MERASTILRRECGDLIISERKLRHVEACELVRANRESAVQTLGFASRPFVLCALPIKRPPAGTLLHSRRNGDFVLEITGHPRYGLPWGQDRLVPIFLATLAVRQRSQTIVFPSAAELLETFGMHQGGSQYRRLIGAFQRAFGATIFFGTEVQRERAAVIDESRFSFMREARIWCSRRPGDRRPPAGCRHHVVLSDEFYHEISSHPIPTDLDVVKALAGTPAALDLFTWLSYRCFIAKGRERIPLFGPLGLVHQFGTCDYSRPRKFRERLAESLRVVLRLWPECPARINEDGAYLVVAHGLAVHPKASG